MSDIYIIHLIFICLNLLFFNFLILGEVDRYYQASGYSYSKSDGKYQPKGNYATTGSSYTKAESDSRYTPKNWVGEIYNGTLNEGNSVKVNYDVRGRSLYMLSDRNEIGLTEIRIPADNLLVTINNGDRWTRMKTTENGTRIHIVASTLMIKKLYLI